MLGLGGGGLEIVLAFEDGPLIPGALVRGAKVFDLGASGPDVVGRVLSSLLCLVGLGDLAALGDLVAEVGLEMAGLVVLITGCLAGCGCQPEFRALVGGESVRFIVGLALSTNKESLLFDRLRADLCTGGDFFAGSLLGFLGAFPVVSRFFEGGERSFLAADSFLSNFSLGGRAGAVEDVTGGGVGVDPFGLLSR